jgi:hypothetical protein
LWVVLKAVELVEQMVGRKAALMVDPWVALMVGL